MKFADLPDECLVRVLEMAGPDTTIACLSTCHAARRAALTPLLWKEVTVRKPCDEAATFVTTVRPVRLIVRAPCPARLGQFFARVDLGGVTDLQVRLECDDAVLRGTFLRSLCGKTDEIINFELDCEFAVGAITLPAMPRATHVRVRAPQASVIFPPRTAFPRLERASLEADDTNAFDIVAAAGGDYSSVPFDVLRVPEFVFQNDSLEKVTVSDTLTLVLDPSSTLVVPIRARRLVLVVSEAINLDFAVVQDSWAVREVCVRGITPYSYFHTEFGNVHCVGDFIRYWSTTATLDVDANGTMSTTPLAM